ncbi:LOW QUALITY PROTEIN: sterile alpha motif domain-containing protein 15 [Arvicanthis niloticus]|uniref:LOW QUALITY PROTEIN: sterile alpha motif domain-containing protein 15 n=1 Tax=Arvicanthis niloticus TaxID=61156 RepID=UPI0014864AC5|nr:LOW QUALITY PROTEIN: sterile alpha motif domain-containing protein 15 [Arvicanthis niloticus]
MSEVPKDYNSDSNESLSLQPKITKSGNLHNAKADTMFKVSSELSPKTGQDPGNVLPESTRTRKEDLKVPDLQSPDVSVGVLKGPPTETNTQLPTKTDPKRKTPDFQSEKPRKSVKEEDLSPSKMTNLEKKQKESAKEKRAEPYEVTKPKFSDRKLRKSTEEADLKPPEERQVKATEQPEQNKFPDKKLRPSTKKKVSEPLLDFGEESRRPSDEASPEPSGKRTSKASKKAHKSSFDEKFPEVLEEITQGLLEEIKSDVQLETEDESISEKVPEPLGDRKPTAQRHKLKRSSGESKLKDTLLEPSKERDSVRQTQTEPQFPKEKLTKSTEKTGDETPLQIPNPDIQEKSQAEPTKKSLELPNEPQLEEKTTEFPKEDSSKSSKPKYPVDKHEIAFSDNHTKLLEKKTAKIKTDFLVRTPRESGESFSTVYEAHEFLKDLQADMNELFPMIPASESQTELRDSIALPQEVATLLTHKESKPSLSTQFEHLNWSPERVAEWISDLGFPQYKECFTENFISGRKLIHVNCSNLPQMGITDFEDMKAISHYTRQLLGIEEPQFSRSISLPYRDNIGLFLERKGHSGVKSDALTLSEFVEASGLQEYNPEIKTEEKNEDPVPENTQEENEGFYDTT